MSKVERLHQRIYFRWVSFEDWLCMKDWWIAKQNWAYQQDGWLGRQLCRVLGHAPISDHCGLPEHDYCAWCNTPMPGKAHV